MVEATTKGIRAPTRWRFVLWIVAALGWVLFISVLDALVAPLLANVAVTFDYAREVDAAAHAITSFVFGFSYVLALRYLLKDSRVWLTVLVPTLVLAFAGVLYVLIRPLPGAGWDQYYAALLSAFLPGAGAVLGAWLAGRKAGAVPLT